MNPRERILAMLVAGAVVVAGGGFLVYQFFLAPLSAKERSAETAREEINRKQIELNQALADHRKLHRYKQLTLPGDPNIASREYEIFLRDLLIGSGFSNTAIEIMVRPPDTKQSPTLSKKQPIYTTLQFVVDATGRLENIVRVLEKFYRTGLLHTIRNFSVELPPIKDAQQRPEDLKLKLTIESLIVNGADQRPYLLPNIDRRFVALDAITALRGGPTGLAWLTWAVGPTGPKGPGALATKPRKYSAIAGKNIFIGMPDKKEIIETTKYVYLSQIVTGGDYAEAYFHDRFNEKFVRLVMRPGSNFTNIQSNSGDTVITIKAVKIEPRDVIFSVGDKYYTIHLGENLAYAMEEPLSQEEVDDLLKDGVGASSK